LNSELCLPLLCDEQWPKETENLHQDSAMLRVLHLKEQEVNEVLDNISVPAKNILLTEN